MTASVVDILLDTVRAGRDPFDVFPWSWQSYGSSECVVVAFDGSSVGDVSAAAAPLICQVVNVAAAERYGTAVPAIN